MAAERRFGLYDTEDRLWMGNKDGPILFEGEVLADIAAMICDRTLHQRMGRTRALPYIAGEMELRDSKPLLETPEEALAHLEEGL
jgi:hypothetical protein